MKEALLAGCKDGEREVEFTEVDIKSFTKEHENAKKCQNEERNFM